MNNDINSIDHIAGCMATQIENIAIAVVGYHEAQKHGLTAWQTTDHVRHVQRQKGYLVDLIKRLPQLQAQPEKSERACDLLVQFRDEALAIKDSARIHPQRVVERLDVILTALNR